jgi:hypothetical protein
VTYKIGGATTAWHNGLGFFCWEEDPSKNTNRNKKGFVYEMINILRLQIYHHVTACDIQSYNRQHLMHIQSSATLMSENKFKQFLAHFTHRKPD